MSFRWNFSQRDPSDKSFIMHGNELVATSIGITANRTMLSCVMNMDAKDYKYYKTQAEVLQSFANVYNKVKQWAFRQIQKFTHYHRDFTNTVFLPDALNNGNYGALSKFLEKLRTNRVGAYVNLSLQESKGYFQKAATLLKPTTKMVKERMKFGFVRLKKNMLYERSRDERRLILQQLSSIENKDSEYTTPNQKQSKQNLINLTYTLIKLNPEKFRGIERKQSRSTSKHSSRSLKKQRKVRQINIEQLLTESHVKEYQFKNLDIENYYSTRVKRVQKV